MNVNDLIDKWTDKKSDAKIAIGTLNQTPDKNWFNTDKVIEIFDEFLEDIKNLNGETVKRREFCKSCGESKGKVFVICEKCLKEAARGAIRDFQNE